MPPKKPYTYNTNNKLYYTSVMYTLLTQSCLGDCKTLDSKPEFEDQTFEIVITNNNMQYVQQFMSFFIFYSHWWYLNHAS